MPATKWFQHVIETPEPGQWELSGYEAAVPITEKSNPLTRDLDIADAEKIVRLLGQCDAEIFQEEGQALPTYQVDAGKKRVIVVHISVGLSVSRKMG
uniref:glucokinase regulatory protein-like isoform X2 n=1 Tax=Callithrix jacchus TaxID=9483 RepID=UPI0023DD1715|nr:glucokinase regulatory protein-like isoform X2 [Callithrix jacchus]